ADATLTLELGSIGLSLPLLGDHERLDVPEPSNPDPLPRYESLEPGRAERVVERDLAKGVTRYRVVEDTGLNRHPENGLASRDIREESWSIAVDDPLSVTGLSRWTCIIEREGWNARTLTVSKLSCTQRDWVIEASVEAFENGERVFSRSMEKKIPRDMM